MNRDEVIRMAREQGLPETETEGVFRVNIDDLGRMLAAEREACARVCLIAGLSCEVRQGAELCFELSEAILERNKNETK